MLAHYLYTIYPKLTLQTGLIPYLVFFAVMPHVIRWMINRWDD